MGDWPVWGCHMSTYRQRVFKGEGGRLARLGLLHVNLQACSVNQVEEDGVKDVIFLDCLKYNGEKAEKAEKPCLLKKKVGAMHFIYQINRLTTTKVDSTYFGLFSQQYITYMSVAGLERMTTESVASALPYCATQVDVNATFK